MKFAFIIMGSFDVEQDQAMIHGGLARIIGVANLDEACNIAEKLVAEGIDCIELCGAFGMDGTKKIIAATKNRIPVGYVTHLPEQDDLYVKAFSK